MFREVDHSSWINQWSRATLYEHTLAYSKRSGTLFFPQQQLMPRSYQTTAATLLTRENCLRRHSINQRPKKVCWWSPANTRGILSVTNYQEPVSLDYHPMGVFLFLQNGNHSYCFHNLRRYLWSAPWCVQVHIKNSDSSVAMWRTIIMMPRIFRFTLSMASENIYTKQLLHLRLGRLTW